MPLNFPTSPVLNQLYTFNGKTWKWDGAGWRSYNVAIPASQGPTGPTGARGATGPVGNYVESFNGVTGIVEVRIENLDVITSNRSNNFPLVWNNDTELHEYKSVPTLLGNYVISVNGSTGAITNVARTNTTQTFTGTQNFQSGISAYGATLSYSVLLGTGTTLTYPVKFNSGTNLTTPISGSVEFDGNYFYTTTAHGRGLAASEHISVITSDYLLASSSTPQNAFPSAGDTIPISANTTYLFDGEYVFQTGATAHSVAMSFSFSTLGANPSVYFSTVSSTVAVGTVTRNQDTSFFESIAGGTITTSSSTSRKYITFRGMLISTDSGSLTPQIQFTVAPGGTNYIKVGSFIRFKPIGANNMTSVGNWS